MFLGRCPRLKMNAAPLALNKYRSAVATEGAIQFIGGHRAPLQWRSQAGFARAPRFS